MWNDAHDAYLESRVLAANPVELVAMLYHACAARVREARAHLEGGRIAERSKAINRAHEILSELSTSLDFERGGELSGRLAALYGYMERRLLDANLEQAEAPLVEVLALLSTLSEAWDGAGRDLVPAIPIKSAWAQTQHEEVGAARAWSF